jgi:hypothetical protein
MRRTPVVLGVLSMVFGGLVAAYSAFGLATQSMVKSWSSAFGKMAAMGPPRPGQPDPAKMMEAMGPMLDQLKPYTLSISGGMLLFSLALIGVGWGLYKRQAWSRPASMLWGAAALAFIPFQIWVQTSIIQPRMREIMIQAFSDAQMPPGIIESAFGMQSGITVVFTVLFYAPFPVVLLILMGRSSARNDLLA